MGAWLVKSTACRLWDPSFTPRQDLLGSASQRPGPSPPRLKWQALTLYSSPLSANLALIHSLEKKEVSGTKQWCDQRFLWKGIHSDGTPASKSRGPANLSCCLHDDLSGPGHQGKGLTNGGHNRARLRPDLRWWPIVLHLGGTTKF